jgi:hypothetical protein
MADTKISAMTAATLPLTGAELVPIVQSGDNKKTTVGDIIAYNRAYGAWSDSTDQTGSISAGTVITYNTQDVADGVTLVDNSKLTVPNTGIYDLQFSAQLKNVDNTQHEVVIWFKVNGSDLANSATTITVPARKTSNIFGYAVAAWNIFLDMNSADYVQIFWLPSSTQVTLEHLPASVTPAYPAIPSIIVSVQQVS